MVTFYLKVSSFIILIKFILSSAFVYMFKLIINLPGYLRHRAFHPPYFLNVNQARQTEVSFLSRNIRAIKNLLHKLMITHLKSPAALW